MMRRLCSIIKRKEKGFSLIEMAVALAITGAISGVITMGVFQTMDYSARDSARMTAVKQVENAIHYISRDVQQARTITPAVVPDPDGIDDGFPLQLSWVDWVGNQYQVTYTIADNELERSYSENAVVMELTVARHIDAGSSDTSCSYNGVFQLKITATVSGYPAEISETREIQITPRSG